VKRDIIVLALLALVVFGIYGGSLDYPFEFDDTHVILTNTKVQDPSYIPKFFYERGMFPEEDALSASYRPLLFTTYSLNYMASGTSPRSYRLTNILIHVLCAFLVYLIACSLLAQPPPGGKTAAPGTGVVWPYALGAALLFAVHPIQTEAVVYITARSSSLTAALCLASLWSFIRYHKSRRPGWLAGTYIAYGAALLCKETAVPFLLVFPLTARALESGRTGARLSFRAYAPLVAGAVALAVRRVSLLKSYAGHQPLERGMIEQWMSGLAAVAKYLKLMVFPFGLSIEHGFTPVTGVADIRFLLGAALAAAALAAFWYFYRRNPLVSMLIAWPFVALSPEILLRVKDIVVEYRMYLPMAGILILAAYLARRYTAAPARGGASVAAVLITLTFTVGLSVLSYDRVRVWQSPVSLWSDVVSLYPDNVRARNNLGMAMGVAGDYSGAMEQLQAAVRLDPTDFEAIINLGNVYAETGRFQKSIEVYKSALTIKPTDYSVNYNLALSYIDMGDFDSAYAIFARMLTLFPGNRELPKAAAGILSSHGRPDLAARLIREYSSPETR